MCPHKNICSAKKIDKSSWVNKVNVKIEKEIFKFANFNKEFHMELMIFKFVNGLLLLMKYFEQLTLKNTSIIILSS